MNKDFDSVALMRKIRDELSHKYQDPEVEERELEEIRKRYAIK